MSEKATGNIVVPVVNLNGTSREELRKQGIGVYNALSNVEAELRNMLPHGRDYQTVGFDRYALAREQHMDRVRKIEAIKSEIYEIIRSLDK